MTGRTPPLLLLLWAAQLGCLAADSSVDAPPAGLLARTLDLLGWGRPAQADPPPAVNATAMFERFGDRVLDSVTERLKAIRSVHQSATAEQHHRTKRYHPVREPLTTDEHGVDVLLADNGAEALWEIPAAGAQHVHLFSDRDKIYALAAFGAGSRTSWLYELTDNVWEPRYNFSSFGTLRFTSFARDTKRSERRASANDTRYVIGAEFDCGQNRADKRGPILYKFKDGEVRYQHVLPIAYPTDVAIWSDYDTFHIGVSSEFEVRPGGEKNYHVNSSIFKWTDGNFRQHFIPTYGAKDIEHFQIQNHFFVAVANYRNNDGSLNVYSEIRRYSLGTGRYRPYQRLLTHGAVRFRHFSWGRGVAAEHFLVVANQADHEPGDAETNYRVDSVVYKFAGTQFVPFQCIPTVRVRDVLPISGPDGEFVLALVDDEGLKLYQYTGWRFVLASLVPLPPAGAAVTGLGSFTHAGSVLLTVGVPGGASGLPTVYRLRFRRRTDLRDLRRRLMTWCEGQREELRQLRPRLDQLRARLEAAPKRDQPVSFRSVRLRTNVSASLRSVSVSNVRLKESVTLNAGLLERLGALRDRLQTCLASVARMQEQLSDAVTIDGNHTLTQDVTVNSTWHMNTALVHTLHVRQLNGVADLAALLARVVWIDRPFEAGAAHLIFNSLEFLNGSKLQVGSLNGLNPFNFVTLSGDHVITASKVINGHVTAADLTVHGLVNGVRIAADTVITQGQLPAGPYHFGSLTVENLDVRFINGIDVPKILQQAVSSSSGVLPGKLVFAGPVLIQSATVQTINGLSVDRLLRNALRTSGGQTITGAWTIDELHVDGELTLNGTLNGLRVPDDVVLINRPDLVYSLDRLSFSSVTIKDLTVTESLGPVKVVDGQLPLLLTSGDQVVVGRKTIGTLYLSGDSTVGGLINGMNVSVAALNNSISPTVTVINGDKVITGDVTFLGDVRLMGLVNGQNVSALLDSALKLSDKTLPHIVFTDDLVISGGLQTPLLNGLSPADWVRTDGVSQRVTGNKAFSQLTAAALSVDLLNDLPLDDFYRGVLRTVGDQQVFGPIVFASDVAFNSLKAGSVQWQDYDLSDAVTVTGKHLIRGAKVYTGPLKVSDLSLTNLWVDGLIDGVNLTALLAGVGINKTHTVMTGSQTFTSRVTVNTLTVDGTMNGQDLLPLLEDAVMDGIVNGDLVFENDVIVDDFHFLGSFDGVSSDEFGSAWLTSDGGQTLGPAGPLSSTADITVRTLEVTGGGALNGVPGDQLFADLVRLDNDVVINANVTFNHLVSTALTVEQNLVNMSDVVRQNQSEIILGSKVFSGGMYALGSFTVSGPVNGVQLDELCDRVVLTDRPASFSRLTVNGNVTFHNVSSPLSWTVNGLNLSQLESQVWLRDANQTLTGQISLHRPRLAAVHTETLLVGEPAVPVDLMNYLQNYWSRSRPQVVTGAVTFLGGLTVDRLTADRLTVSGLVNGKDLSAVMATALSVNGGTVTGHWTLPDVVIHGSVTFSSLNGIPASSLIKTSATELHFSTHQTVGHLYVQGNIILPDGGRLYDMDVSDHLNISNFLLRHGSFVVTSDVVFDSHVLTFTRPLTVQGTINGVPIGPSTLLTLSGEQTVPGNTHLVHVGDQCLSVPDLITSRLNGIDLNRLLHWAVRLDGSYNITGRWTFAIPPVILEPKITNSTSQRQLTELVQLLLSALEQLQQVDEATARQYVVVIRDLYQALLDARERLQVASYLQYYVETQTWQSDIIRFAPVYVDGNGSQPTFLLAIWEGKIQLLRWVPDGNFGLWTDGPVYPEAGLAWMAGLRRAAGTGHAAVARMVAPPPTAAVPDAVYRWDDPVLDQLQGAVNYIFLYYRDDLAQSQAVPSHKTVDVKSLQPSPAHDCFLFVHFLGNVSHLVCYRDTQTKFAVHQTIETLGGRQASVFSAGGEVCVAVANSGGDGRVDIWCWDAGLALLTRRQTIASPAAGVTTALFHRHLVLAVVEMANYKLDGLINVYRFESSISKFVHMQTLSVPGVTTAQLLVLPSDELTLNCLTRSGRVVYLVFAGGSWFRPGGEFSVGQAASLEAFNLAGLSTQLAVAGRPRADMFALSVHYPAAVYMGKFMGHAW